MLEITQFINQMTCFTGRVIYSWMFLADGQVSLFQSPLRSGDQLART